MRREIITYELTCDGCGEKVDGIRSYTFTMVHFDGHRSEDIDVSIDLCPVCQRKAHEAIVNSVLHS